MSIKAINTAISAHQHNKLNEKKQQHQQSFTGSFNPIVTLMDGIEKGGFAASFIAQDGIGMVAPRIGEGLNRNRKVDENGKKTGPLNWEFARREGIREVLSGPSAFLIPLGILSVLKKTSGTANNVHVNHINVLGQNFAQYASAHPEQMADAAVFKKGYYAQIFENALEHSTDKGLNGDQLKQTAQSFADRLVEAEAKRASKDKKSANKLIGSIVEDYMKLRKQYASPSANEFGAVIDIPGKDKKLGTNIKTLIQSLTDYSGDALHKVNKKLAKDAGADIKTLVENFNLHRAGTRVLANLGMWSAVVGFYTLIPKLYNMGLKQDPGLKGLVEEEEVESVAKQIENNENGKDKKDVSFGGAGGTISKIGDAAIKEGGIGKLLKNFEFNGASMSVPAMLTLLFGFCFPPRYINAKSEEERKEIGVRDLTSFTAILFGAKALSRGFSDAFARMSGLALNIKPEDHNKGFLHKVKNYVTAGAGIDVLSSEQIVSKYSNIQDYKDGINGFFTFLEENGGNPKKVLSMDKDVKAQAEEIMKKFSTKSLKEATLDELHEAFKKAKGSDMLEKIYTAFATKDNKFINRAKTMNSAFGFASTLVLVPAFMMWLARYCENMTKKAIAQKKNAAQPKVNVAQNQQPQQVKPVIASNTPTMAGFLNK